MAFSPLSICRKLLSGSSSRSRSVARRICTTTAPTESLKISSPSKIQNNSSSPCTSPWLMLPPTLNDDGSSIDYRIYSFAESRIQTLTQTIGLSKPIHDLRFRGSSHGWIALFNQQTFDLFLYDPISLRHIELPPMPNRREVAKVTLSCSPDDDQHNCRAVMFSDCTDALAFCCCPGRSKEWTPIGKTAYKDFVYSTRQNLFFALTKSYELETWDLSDPSSPRMVKMIKTDLGDPSSPRNIKPIQTEEDKNFYGENASPVEYLVVAGELSSDNEDDVLLVTWSLKGDVLDETFAPLDLYPPISTGFDIDVYDEVEGGLKPLGESLGDLTLFIGCHSDSVALSATRFPELKPDSIYFTEPFEPISLGSEVFSYGEDFGIFNYEDKTHGVCYIPCDIKRLKKVGPSAMWFFPRGSV